MGTERGTAFSLQVICNTHILLLLTYAAATPTDTNLLRYSLPDAEKHGYTGCNEHSYARQNDDILVFFCARQQTERH